MLAKWSDYDVDDSPYVAAQKAPAAAPPPMEPLEPAAVPVSDAVQWPDRDVCVLANLPYTATVADIEEFIKKEVGFYPRRVTIQYDRDRRPSGYATVELRDLPDLKDVYYKCEGALFKNRPIRVQFEKKDMRGGGRRRERSRTPSSDSSSVSSRRRNSSASSDSSDEWKMVGSKSGGRAKPTENKKNDNTRGRFGNDDRRKGGYPSGGANRDAPSKPRW
eukprot:GDKJ01006370.1.p1 GENE.GDKJ01006370.1~~GDKJ01006370.1.p1  ORF type:complete len:219 (-),score=73.55 GDKJ01006370.1:277-933(-)